MGLRRAICSKVSAWAREVGVKSARAAAAPKPIGASVR